MRVAVTSLLKDSCHHSSESFTLCIYFINRNHVLLYICVYGCIYDTFLLYYLIYAISLCISLLYLHSHFVPKIIQIRGVLMQPASMTLSRHPSQMMC